jgi:hypothetical protein
VGETFKIKGLALEELPEEQRKALEKLEEEREEEG